MRKEILQVCLGTKIEKKTLQNKYITSKWINKMQSHSKKMFGMDRRTDRHREEQQIIVALVLHMTYIDFL